MRKPIAEHTRLDQQRAGTTDWQQWGPYLSERAWGTVREDYSEHGEAWEYFPHDHARSRVYRWGEDGLASISDARQYLCFALALWNGADPILKERMFGLTGSQGNHGEDVKEYYFYLDSTPTHSYMKMLYKYPQREFPYGDLVAENGRRGFDDFEYELLDTGAFDDDKYFDVLVEYAKADVDDILIRISVTNQGAETAQCTVLPTLWFRNTWAWGYPAGPMGDVPHKPGMYREGEAIVAEHPALGTYYLYASGAAEILFTENDTHTQRLFGLPNATPYVKDAFHRYVVNGETEAVNPEQHGTKASPVYHLDIAPGETQTIYLRLSSTSHDAPFADAEATFAARLAEANAFYEAIHGAGLSADARAVQRQALAGMLWSKQLFYYDIAQWLKGDPLATPPARRKQGRNHDWQHLNNFDIVSMPDKWEYPWYAVWDLAFHCIPLAMVDTEFAKSQLLIFTREWYMHPNGQLPAYEWAFGDVNPPVHAWAAWRVYEMDGAQDQDFLKRIFNKMLLNFTWWVNRKDADGNNVFQGGFLGLDNISLFDRSAQLPTGGHIDQSDGTAWMGFYCLVMMTIALELAKHDPPYEDLAVKFYEHFLWIAQAISGAAHGGIGLWDADDGFFYDVLHTPSGDIVPLKVRSLVGLMPLIAVETVGQATLERFPTFARSIEWLCAHRPHLAENLAEVDVPGYGSAHLFAMPNQDRLRSVLRYMLDENEFLSEFGIRSVSKIHETPYGLHIGGSDFSIAYWPAESKSGLFGGNSNWRGPVWFPINYLLIESLRKYHRYYGDDFMVECPTGSGVMLTLDQIADEVARRLSKIFLLDDDGRRPVFGRQARFQSDTAWRDYILFHEYFHGDNGAGLGASHQTGWTGLVAELLQPKPSNESRKE
ncbi:MAG: MGH1-like glycoside hydrolase domain-containing protein [Anaerolineales bacterium]